MHIHFNRTIWKVTGLSFLLHLLLIYMCDFLEEKRISFEGHKQFALLFSNNPTSYHASTLFFSWWCDNPPMFLILTRFLHFYFSLRSINEHGLQGGVHAKCPTASKLIRNKKACRASGESSIKWCTLWPLGDHSSAGSPGISFLKKILKPEAQIAIFC